jgi:hypothetical protein
VFDGIKAAAIARFSTALSQKYTLANGWTRLNNSDFQESRESRLNEDLAEENAAFEASSRVPISGPSRLSPQFHLFQTGSIVSAFAKLAK